MGPRSQCKDLEKVDNEAYTDIIIVNFHDDPEQEGEWEVAVVSRTLLFQADNKIIFSSTPLNPHHVETVKKLAGWKRVLNIHPTNPSTDIGICEDLMEQDQLNYILKRVLSNSPGINIIPRFRSTPYFKFLNYVRKLGFTFNTPETMDEGRQFIPQYYDRKSGFRATFSTLLMGTTVKMPEGFIVSGKQDICDACFHFRDRNRSCVVKQDIGFSGQGILFVAHEKLSPCKEKFNQQLLEMMDDELCKDWGSIFSWNACCVVEEMVDIDKNNLQGVISVEFRALDGQVSALPPCTMLMEEDGKTFKGILMSPEVERNPLIAETLKAGKLFSEIVAAQGYRGYLDMDCLISKDGNVYALESNVRRTGGTYVHQFLLYLLGPGYTNHYWCASEENRFGKDTRMFGYDTYYNILSDLYLKKEGSEQKWRGVMLSNPDMLTMNSVDVITVSSSAEDLNDLRKEVKSRLATLHPEL